MNGYEKRTNIKKEAIIKAARELFTLRGIKDVGISEIASKAHVSQVSIYNYFGDKEALVKKVLDFYLEKAIKEYEEILAKAIPFPEKLTLALERKHDSEAETIRSYFSEYAWEDNDLQLAFNEAAIAKSAILYKKFIELGKDEGAIDKKIPDEAILAYIFSIVPIMHHPDFQKTVNEYTSGIYRLFLHGLLGK